MDGAHIAELLQPFLGGAELNPHQLHQVQVYLDLLLKWNAKMNLTAVRHPEDIINRHFGESFFAATRVLDAEVHSLIDFGSGAGFPGLPMAIYSLNAKVILIESQNKKATFLKEAVRALGLANVEIFSGRGEAYPVKADLVILRAVEKFVEAAKIAAGLVAKDGRLALMIGHGHANGLPAGFQWGPQIQMPGAEARVLAVGRKSKDSIK